MERIQEGEVMDDRVINSLQNLIIDLAGVVDKLEQNKMPWRLQIAAQIMAAAVSNPGIQKPETIGPKFALAMADALIKAANEGGGE
jgi:hypothetical protein